MCLLMKENSITYKVVVSAERNNMNLIKLPQSAEEHVKLHCGYANSKIQTVEIVIRWYTHTWNFKGEKRDKDGGKAYR